MITTKIFAPGKDCSAIFNNLLEECRQKWGDADIFLKNLCAKADRVAVAYCGSKIVGFSLVKRLHNDRCVALAFLATRVLLEFRAQGVAKRLLRKIILNSLIKDKLFHIANWIKPMYMVTSTANPIIYNTLRMNFNAYPSVNPGAPDELEKALALGFAGVFSSVDKFNDKNFVIKEAFQNSAEHYPSQNNIPWSKNEINNKYLSERINLTQHAGDGLVLVAKLQG